jgi:hypothetical protein
MSIRTFQDQRHARNLALAARRNPERRRKREAAEFAERLRRLAAAITEFHQNLPPAKSQTISPNAAMDQNDNNPSR